MTEELRKCLSVLFRQKGKDLMNEREFVYAVSMDLHWFTPKDAQVLLDSAIKNGLLRMSQGMLAPTFEFAEEQLDIEYRPSQNLIKTATKTEKKDLFVEIVDKIVAKSGLSKKEIVSRINKAKEKMPIDIEVAALIVARSLEIDVEDDIAVVEKEIFSRKSEGADAAKSDS